MKHAWILSLVLGLSLGTPHIAKASQPESDDVSDEWDDDSSSEEDASTDDTTEEGSGDEEKAESKEEKADAAPAAKGKRGPDNRKWGLGTTVLGLGFRGLYARDVGGESAFVFVPWFDFLSFEARAFLKSGHSIDISVPVFWPIIAGVSPWFRVLWVQADVYYNFDLPVGKSGRTRLLAGPGLGFWVYSPLGGAGVIGGPRIVGEIGAEFLLAQNRIGLQVFARPWLTLAGGTLYGEGGFALDTGLLACFGIQFYKLKDGGGGGGKSKSKPKKKKK